MKPSEATKAIGVAVAGALAWGAQVVASAPAQITAAEWLALGGVGAATLACFGLTNTVPTSGAVTNVIQQIKGDPGAIAEAVQKAIGS